MSTDLALSSADADEMAMIEHTGKRLVLASQFAETMCRASLLPEHLRTTRREGKVVQLTPDEVKANCILIVNQALRWRVDPFAILPSTFVIAGKLGFDGKLIAAIVNKNGGLRERLSYTFEGVGDDLTVTVSGTLDGESEPRTVRVAVRDAKTDNEIWKKDPEQKLVYTGATRWARRHCPHVILGIVSDDEPAFEVLDSVAVPTRPAVSDRVREVVESYNARIDETDDVDELTRLVDKINAEPLELVPDRQREELTARARRRYSAIKRSGETPPPAETATETATETDEEANEKLLLSYETQIEQSKTRMQVAELLEDINSDERLSIAERKRLGDFGNRFAKTL